MRPFLYQRAGTPNEAIQASIGQNGATQFLAGGTTLLDLMKLDVMRPERIIDINPLDGPLAFIAPSQDGLRLGALSRMSDVAEHETVRQDYPVIAQALQLAASQQLRNMASLGGNAVPARSPDSPAAPSRARPRP